MAPYLVKAALRWAGAPGIGAETVRGVRLPVGMTRACCDELGLLFSRANDPEDGATNDELAALAFEVVRSHLR